MSHSTALSIILTVALIQVGIAAEQPQSRRGHFTFEQFSARHDANQDGKISVLDLSYIVAFLSPAYAGTTPPYTTPDGDCVPLP